LLDPFSTPQGSNLPPSTAPLFSEEDDGVQNRVSRCILRSSFTTRWFAEGSPLLPPACSHYWFFFRDRGEQYAPGTRLFF